MTIRSSFLTLIFIPFSFSAQEKIVRGKIKDDNKQPVAYASVGIVGTSYGTVADEEGDFIFYLPAKASVTDTLKISCTGFSSAKIPVTRLPDFLNVNLTLQAIHLPEVLVKAKTLKTKVIGSTRGKTLMKFNFAIGDKPNQNLGSEIGRKFFFKGSKHYLNKLNVFAAYNFDTVLFRLNIYSLKNGLPDSNLLTENIIIKLIKPKIAWTEFDLRKYNLVYSQNIVVALQWIGHSKKGTVVQLPIAMPAPGAVHFYKFGCQDKWSRYNNMSTAINLQVEVEN